MPIDARPLPISIEKTAEVFDTYRTFLAHAGVSIKNMSIADFGCAKGVFLQALMRNNVCHGYDISEKVIQLCKSAFPEPNVRFTVMDLNSSSLETEDEYDLITFFDVIEHLVNFTHLRNVIQNNLKNKGYVVVTTPNANSLMRVLGSARIFSGEADPTHTMLFTPYTLDFFLRRSGLTKVCLSTPYIFYFKNDLITKKVLFGGQIFALYRKVA